MQILNPKNLECHHKLAIIIMSFNQSAFLRDCVQSILAQSYQNFVVIIHDDASTDESQELIRSFVAQNENITGILRSENRFSIRNDLLNTILVLVDSEFILRIDGDDYLLNRNQIAEQVTSLEEQSNTSFVYSDYLIQNELKNSICRIQVKGVGSKDNFIPFVNFAGIAVMFRKPSADLFPANFQDVRAQDWYLLNLLMRMGKSHHLPYLTPVYRVHSHNGYYGIRDNKFLVDSRIIRKFAKCEDWVRDRPLVVFALNVASKLETIDRLVSRNRVLCTTLFNKVTCKVALIVKSRYALRSSKKLLARIVSDFNHKMFVEENNIRIRFMSSRDFLQLRKLKNANRSRFFYSQKLGYFRHFIWFIKCRFSISDSMLIAYCESGAVACFGFRLRNSSFDLYNVMRFTNRNNSKKSPIIGRILQEVCTSIYREYSISIKAEVLSDNPALMWYHRNGFEECSRDNSSVTLEFSRP